MKQIDNIISCHEYYHIKENYTQEDFIYANKKAIENPTLADLTTPIQFNPLVSLEQFDIWMYESLKLRNNTMNKDNLETDEDKVIRHSCVANPTYFGGPIMGKTEECTECMDYIKANTPEPENVNWWENSENFPCMLIADVSVINIALVWVYYQIDGIAYDVRDHEYRLIEHTNWRRATREEILNNIKGL